MIFASFMSVEFFIYGEIYTFWHRETVVLTILTILIIKYFN